MLFDGLKKIKPGTTLKLEIFKRIMNINLFFGHSLLIKKVDENDFIFFDPNTGEHRYLSETDLEKKINDRLNRFGCTNILLVDGDSYINHIKRQLKSEV